MKYDDLDAFVAGLPVSSLWRLLTVFNHRYVGPYAMPASKGTVGSVTHAGSMVGPDEPATVDITSDEPPATGQARRPGELLC